MKEKFVGHAHDKTYRIIVFPMDASQNVSRTKITFANVSFIMMNASYDRDNNKDRIIVFPRKKATRTQALLISCTLELFYEFLNYKHTLQKNGLI